MGRVTGVKPIRNSAKAVIIQNGKILLTKNVDQEGFFYLLPGGGVEKGETLHQALKRECLEEIGVEVVPQDLIFLREYIGKHHEHAATDADVHQVEFMFLSSFVQEAELTPLAGTDSLYNGSNPDDHQVGVEWVDLEKLHEIRLYPKVLKKHLLIDNLRSNQTYLGDVN